MPLTATFAADLSQFSKSLAEAQVELQVFDRATRNATRGLTREMENLSGQRVAAEAARMAEAVQRIGGVSRLTAAEQQRVNRVMEEATEKFRVLGVEAPQAMLDIAAATRRAEQPLIGLSSVLQGVVAGATAAVTSKLLNAGQALISFGLESAARGAQLSSLRRSFDNLSGGVETANASLSAMRAGSLGLVADLELIQAGNKALLLNLGLSSEEMGELARTATVLGRAMGQDATKSLDDLITALGRSSPLILDNLGLTVKVGEANDAYAASLGKSASQLTEAEKRQAFMAAAMASARAKVAELGDAQLTAVEAGSKLWTGFVNLTDATANWILANRWAQGTINTLVQGMTTLEITIREGPLAAWQEYMRAQVGALPVVSDAGRVHERLGLTVRGVALDEEALFRALEGTTGELKRATDAVKAVDEVMRQAKLFGGADALANGEQMITVLRQLGGPLRVLPSQLRQFEQAFQGAAEAAVNMGLSDRARDFQLLARTMNPAVQLQQRYNVTIGEFVTPMQDYTEAIRDQIVGWSEYGDVIQIGPLPNTMKLLATLERFESVSMQRPRDEIVSLGETLRQSVAEVAERIPDTIAQALVFGGSLKNAARSLASQLGAAIGRDLGAQVGGKLGAIIGSAVGSMAGLLVDAIASIGRTAEEDVMRRVGYDFGVQISEGLAEGIAEESRRLFRGNRQAAELFNLGDIIAEGGGLNDRNINRMTARLRDIFVMLDTGAFTTAQATEAMNESFGYFADYWTERGGLVSRQMLEIIQLTRQMGVESQAVADFVAEQIAGATNGLATFYQTGADAANELAANQARLAELQAEIGRAGSADRARLEQEIAEVTRAIAQQQAVLDAVGVTTEQQALAAGAAIAAMVAQLQRDGLTIPEALAAVQPAVEALAAQLERAGLSGGAAFEDIRRLAGITSDEVAGPVLTAVSGLAGALEGLHNSGLLTQDVFAGLGSQMTQAFDALLGQGIAGDDALRLMQPTLQRLWQLQQDFGYEVDEATQALLDQAEAAGLVGDAQRDAQERAARAMERVAERLGTIIDRLYGVEDAGRAAARGIDAAARASDGLPAGSRPPEAPAPASGRAASAQAQASAGRSSPPIRVEVPVSLDGYQVARVVVPYVPAASRRLGV